MPLLYLPDPNQFFLWGEDAALRLLPELALGATQTDVELVVPEGRRKIDGSLLTLFETVARLAAVPTVKLDSLPSSFATWILASKLGIELVSRECVVPTIVETHGVFEARWAAALSRNDDAAMVAALARSMSPAAHAIPARGDDALDVWSPETLVRSYLDAVVDTLLRAAECAKERAPSRKVFKWKLDDTGQLPWEQRFRAALEGPDRRFELRGFAERSIVDDVCRWSEPALGARDRLRACFRLELPKVEGEPFILEFLLQSPDDPNLYVSAADIWKSSSRALEILGRAFCDPQESLLEALGRAARLFEPIQHALQHSAPEFLELDSNRAWLFLSEGAAALTASGFGVILPNELSGAGQRRLRLRMRVGGKSKASSAIAGNAGLGMEQLLAVDWEAAIGDDTLSARELAILAKQKAPLSRFRGAWVAIDPRELAEIRAHVSDGPTRITLREAVRAALAGESREGSLSVAVIATGSFADMVERLRKSAASDIPVPKSLRAKLRPYQHRGLAWLSTMSTLGLGACLADDMGLGKTVQLLAWLLLRVVEVPEDKRPTLLVAPTSVVGNWEREVGRFAPSLAISHHYGSVRATSVKEFPKRSGALVITSYGLLRRDAKLLADVKWSAVVLDEAQNIKNAGSATARAARTLRASHRFALTGTPVENRLAELWSILEFANPGFLGSLQGFRREFAVPIERYGNDDMADRLRRIVSPFLLRRLKSDPTIIRDLPKKNEMKVICTLTREQAKLYKSVVDEEMKRIERVAGIARRGRVLALLTFLKQICNHPAQYLGEKGPLVKRSGKLARLCEMLEEAIAAGDKALVFTQYREMGQLLVAQLVAQLGCEVAFLHGGTPRKARDVMIRRFQDEPRGPRIFVLSVKAGGTGLNLTAANHVFHFDRWWNPAVEDQATDRAYRIGQTRTVQVHKFICAGTIEDKVDRMLEQKRDLASKVVSAGENWITEMDNGELRELFALSQDALLDDDSEDSDDKGVARGRAQRQRPASESPASKSPASKSPASKSPASKSPASKSPASKSPTSKNSVSKKMTKKARKAVHA